MAHVAKLSYPDPAHDFSHFERVRKNAESIAKTEGANTDVLIAAAYLHDIANLPKDHPNSSMSSQYSVSKAREILTSIGGFPEELYPLLDDAILCHSYSRGLKPQTLEGQVFQDADRLDAIGAVGIARAYAVGGKAGRPLYWPEDPLCVTGRTPCDKGAPEANTLDHFFIKLFKLPDLMNTKTGRLMAQERVEYMGGFCEQLAREV